MFNQQIHGSKRSLRSVEDFTEFEQRTAYFDGDRRFVGAQSQQNVSTDAANRNAKREQGKADWLPAV